MRRLIAHQRRALASTHDAGFTLIEIIVAMVLVVIVMTALLGVLVSSLQTVAQARQRQTATALATRSLEQLRALPYGSVTGSDLTTAPNADYVFPDPLNPGYYIFKPLATILILPGGVTKEPLVVTACTPPLKPVCSGMKPTLPTIIDGVTYTVQRYVTKAALTAGGQQAYNLTVIVSWKSSASAPTRTIVERSTAFSPAGCLSTANHPFSGPCQAYFTAQAGQSAAAFQVTNPTDSSLDIQGLNGRLVELSLPDLSAGLQIEQTASGNSNVATSGVRTLGTAPGAAGNKPAGASVDSDPSSAPGQLVTTSATQTNGSVSLSGIVAGVGTLSATPGSTDTGTVWSAIAANSTYCREANKSGTTGLNTGPTSTTLRPCSSAKVQPGASGSISYTTAGGKVVSVLTLAAAPFASSAVAASIANLTTPNATACSGTTTTPGCVHSAVYRSLGTLTVGAATGGTGPVGMTSGLFNVAGLAETAVAERGVGAATAPTYTRAGSVKYWNGSTYLTIPLAPSTSTSVTTATVPITYSDGTTVTETSTITIQPATMSTTTDCTTTACVAAVNGAGSLVALTTFTVSSGGATVTTFALVSNLGGVLAQSTYKAAPVG